MGKRVDRKEIFYRGQARCVNIKWHYALTFAIFSEKLGLASAFSLLFNLRSQVSALSLLLNLSPEVLHASRYSHPARMSRSGSTVISSDSLYLSRPG